MIILLRVVPLNPLLRLPLAVSRIQSASNTLPLPSRTSWVSPESLNERNIVITQTAGWKCYAKVSWLLLPPEIIDARSGNS